jgi:hypothetical protein
MTALFHFSRIALIFKTKDAFIEKAPVSPLPRNRQEFIKTGIVFLLGLAA